MAGVRLAGAAKRLRPLDLRRAVPAGRVRDLAVHFDELGVINIGTKTGINCFEIGPMAVAGDLYAIGETPR